MLLKKLQLGSKKWHQERSRKQETAETISKKIKLEQKLTPESISKNYPDIDITDHEVNKFLLISNLLLETSLNEGRLLEVKARDSEDGPIEDTIILVITELISILKYNVEPLKLPKIIKFGLNKLKTYLFFNDGKNKNYSENGVGPKKDEASTEVSSTSSKETKTSKSSTST